MNKNITCSKCGLAIHPIVKNTITSETKYENQTMFFFTKHLECPNCHYILLNSYTDTYKVNSNGTSNSVRGNHIFYPPKHTTFDELIMTISKDFISIYNQSEIAESLGLSSICGPGYRKALEFLVKDFLIYSNVKEKDKISNESLSSAINRLPSKLSNLAKAASWIGNDEVHYRKKHIDYDVGSLKYFIKALVNHIYLEDSLKQASNLINSKK